jgi:hypothetical protein
MKITYVTAYFPFRETPHFQGNLSQDPVDIYHLLSSGIQLCLYVAHDCPHLALFHEWARHHLNFRVMPRYLTTWQDTRIGKILMNDKEWSLPSIRNLAKDTAEFITWTHTRIDLLNDVTENNPFICAAECVAECDNNTTTYVWIESQLPSLLYHRDETLRYLSTDFEREVDSLVALNTVYIPGGCYHPRVTNHSDITESVYWRFCGGFMVFKDGATVRRFHEYYAPRFQYYLEKYHRLVWDVNLMAWFEVDDDEVDIVWYRGDHNDSIVRVLDGLSADRYAICPFTMKQEVQIPKINSIPSHFHPGSISVICVDNNKQTIMNVRYVSYTLGNEGHYLFSTNDKTIYNQNVAIYNNDFRIQVMDQENPTCPDGTVLARPLSNDYRYISRGFEDIRLFAGEPCGQIRFIATNIDYSPVGRNRMIVGDYNHITGKYTNCMCIVPPDPESWCEKNWIPIVLEDKKQYFLYRWSPFELGCVDEGQLRIERTFYPKNALFRKLRGSTIFVPYLDDEQYLVGLAHFSEEYHPRHYYHVLVLLDKVTGAPCRYSDVFYFEKLSVEFCTGFLMEDRGGQKNGDHQKSVYKFWVSRMDRDPCFFLLDAQAIPIHHVVHL